MIDKINAIDIQSIMTQIRQFELRAKAVEPGSEFSLPDAGTKKPAFTDLVTKAIDSVNGLQMDTQNLVKAFESGEDVPLTDVVLSMHKSSVAFEATLQIRNKVMKAYEDIKNMPV